MVSLKLFAMTNFSYWSRSALVVSQAVSLIFQLVHHPIHSSTLELMPDESIDLLIRQKNISEDNPNKIEKDLIERLTDLRSRVERAAVKMSLSECLDYGIRNNYDLAAAYATIQKYEYSLIAQKRQYYPTLNLSSLPPFLGKVYVSTTETQQVAEAVSINPNGTVQSKLATVSDTEDQQLEQFAPYLTMSWSFFQPSLPATISSARSTLNQQRLAFDVSARSAILNLQQSYFGLQSAKSLIDDFEKIYQINLEQVKYIQKRHEAGLIDVGAVDQSRSQLYDQASDLIEYYQSYLENAAKLAFAMNAPGSLIVLPSDKFDIAGEWREDVELTVANALAMREEIEEYLESADASIWSARAAIRSYLPELMLQGYAYAYNQNGLSDELDYSSQYYFGAIGLGVSWNIFDGGVKAAEANAYKSEAKSLHRQADYARQSVKHQVRTAYAAHEASQLNLLNSRLNLVASSNSLKVNRSRFSVGLADITSLVQAMQLFGEATQQYNYAILNYNTSLAELYRYSAKWPGGTETIVKQARRELRHD